MKEIEIDYNGKKEIVKLKRLTFGEMNQVNEQAADIKFYNGQPQVKINQAMLQEMSLLKSIVSAPFTITLDNIRNLDFDVGRILFEEFNALHSQDVKKNVI